MNDDFTEEEEFNELPEGIEFAEPVPRPATLQRPVAPSAAPRAAPSPQAATPQPSKQSSQRREEVDDGVGAEEPAPAERYAPYIMEKKVGIFDNESRQPLMEDTDINNLILGLVTKLLNDIDDIKRNL